MRALASFTLLLFAATAQAAPARLSYQGRLLQADGTPAAGVQTLSFSIFTAPTGGAPLWTESQQVALTDGFYAVALGDATDGGIPAIFDGSELYLELAVGGTPLSPRQRIDSVVYALNAGTATNVRGGTVDASSISVDGKQLVDANGKVPVSNIEGAPDGGFVTAVSAAAPLTSSGGTSPTLGLGPCGPGEVWKMLGPGWTCAADDDTTYSAGSGLALNGTTFAVADGGISFGHWSRNGCATNQVPKWNGTKWVCSTPTVYAAGTGLTLSGSTFSRKPPVQVTSTPVAVVPNSWGYALASCPAGTSVVGGGFTFTDYSLEGKFSDNHPSGNGWYVTWYNSGVTGQTATLVAYAVCL